MKIRLFTIPNMLTLANLLCGALAVRVVLLGGRYETAFMLIILAGVFDFFDGFVARMLGQSSPMGVELDSLADMVSFGLAPAVIMMSLFEGGESLITNSLWVDYGRYIPLLILAFSALRLAKFNIDENQSSEFIGMPTPACALFCGSLGLLASEGHQIPDLYIALISVAMALLLVLPVRMFSLKFKSFALRDNIVRYCFLLASVGLLILFRLNAMALIIPLYALLSIVCHIATTSRFGGERDRRVFRRN